MAYERDSGVDVVHGCFPDKDDFILSIFSREPLRAKLHAKKCISLAS